MDHTSVPFIGLSIKMQNKNYHVFSTYEQRWSPRGHIFKSLTLASKPQVLENCPILGSRTARFFKWLKFCTSAEKCFSRPFFWRSTEKKFLRPFFLGKHLHLCPWSLASSIPVLGFGLGIFFVSLASSLVSSTPPLLPRLFFCSEIDRKVI